MSERFWRRGTVALLMAFFLLSLAYAVISSYVEKSERSIQLKELQYMIA